MSTVNPIAKEILLKIVYYGPGLGGKTTTLQYIHQSSSPKQRGKMVSLATPVDRTLYFDFLPIQLSKIGEYTLRLHIFTVPGQVYYNATRKLVLTGADGVVFVADSQASRMDANVESLENLKDNLIEHNTEFDNFPVIFQYNKRDLPNLCTIEELEERLNPSGCSWVETSAVNGQGVYTTLEMITKKVIRDLKQRDILGKGEKISGEQLEERIEFQKNSDGISNMVVQYSGATPFKAPPATLVNRDAPTQMTKAPLQSMDEFADDDDDDVSLELNEVDGPDYDGQGFKLNQPGDGSFDPEKSQSISAALEEHADAIVDMRKASAAVSSSTKVVSVDSDSALGAPTSELPGLGDDTQNLPDLSHELEGDEDFDESDESSNKSEVSRSDQTAEIPFPKELMEAQGMRTTPSSDIPPHEESEPPKKQIKPDRPTLQTPAMSEQSSSQSVSAVSEPNSDERRYSTTMSFAGLWPLPDRHFAEEIEYAMAQGQDSKAALSIWSEIRRWLLKTAKQLPDATPESVIPLLGLDGRSYMETARLVSIASSKEIAVSREALLRSYLFLLQLIAASDN